MNGRVLFDTSVYIQAIRERRADLLSSRNYGGARLYLSGIVACELLAGAKTARTRRELEKLWRDFEQAGRLIIPQASDWHDAGVVLSQVGVKYGFERVGQARLVHDALISLSARRLGVGVVTLNRADFDLIAEFRPLRIIQPS